MMTRQNPRAEARAVRIKITGPKMLVESLAEAIERDYGAIRTSPILQNDREGGVHVYLVVTEVQR